MGDQCDVCGTVFLEEPDGALDDFCRWAGYVPRPAEPTDPATTGEDV